MPVAIVGTFAVMAAMGFSLNNLTLFGLVLAIGIVVDDAIVVVEAVEHHIEHGLPPREATHQGHGGGHRPGDRRGPGAQRGVRALRVHQRHHGQFFRQFALTIAVSTLISAFNSLTLSPALAALLLRPRDKGRDEVLPRLAYVAIGGWAGYAWLTPLWPPLWKAAAAVLPAASVCLVSGRRGGARCGTRSAGSSHGR